MDLNEQINALNKAAAELRQTQGRLKIERPVSADRSVGLLRYHNENRPPQRNVRIRAMFSIANSYDLKFFCFSPADINIETKTINGLFWCRETKDYVRKETPYPAICDDYYLFKTDAPNLYRELSAYCVMTRVPIGKKKRCL